MSAVIATSAPIADTKAVRLSEQFYRSLTGGRSIRQAFEVAAEYINNNEAEALVAFRGLELEETGEFPWGLYVQDESVLNWKIPKKEAILQSFTGRAHIYGDERKEIPDK